MLSDIPSFKISSKLMRGWKKSVIAQKNNRSNKTMSNVKIPACGREANVK
jgi:hypothetical protein